ncbi:phenazine biosynthesis protein PhzF family [Alkaliphilus metalliredigens QYMF]|uniref:Phenazine biosynthesis protein PhzF family n=1 Tax=Alkaliphilus metalliredigens (strain QYMF) TaxID=293826 RepID=A6TXD8_ALKMQ|nr:PhzF family phenazine biosynthesis protein [Alkaliphilus metalliredigens]ABR50856.1 phenazine biosynthesis protein PhzF family [Alkaliphilus metalliredigens QYMF]
MDYIVYQADAFTNKRFGGNPAAVVPNAKGLEEITMQQIAKEMNLSETAFVFPMDERGDQYEVRFFTPQKEVALCGHATVATFHVLYEKGYIKRQSRPTILKQRTKAGLLKVYLDVSQGKLQKVMMEQALPEIINHEFNQVELCNILGIKVADMGINEIKVKPQIISTGLRDIIVPIKSLEVLKKMKIDMEKLSQYSKKVGVVGLHAFTLETMDKRNTAHCRNFAPAVGINEESATGTANGALAVFLAANEIISIKEEKNLIFEQGYFMDRPSTIHCTIKRDQDNYSVNVGGQAVIVLEGVLKFP